MHQIDHPTELILDGLRPLGPSVGRREGGVRRKETERRVAPIVGEAQVFEVRLRGERLHGQQLHGRDAKALDVVHRGGVREARVGATEVFRHAWQLLREALDVDLVDNGVRPWRGGLWRGQLVGGLDRDHRARHERRGVRAVARAQQGRRPGVGHLGERAFQPAAVGVKQELVDVVAQALLGIPRARRSEAVALTRPDIGDKRVPYAVAGAVEGEAGLLALRIEEAQEHSGGVRGPDANGHAAVHEVNA